MPFAARDTDPHTCPITVKGTTTPHQGGVIKASGASKVFIGFLPAAVERDECICGESGNKIAKGSGTVNIGGKPAARMGDMTEHGGVITGGEATVNIGG